MPASPDGCASQSALWPATAESLPTVPGTLRVAVPPGALPLRRGRRPANARSGSSVPSSIIGPPGRRSCAALRRAGGAGRRRMDFPPHCQLASPSFGGAVALLCIGGVDGALAILLAGTFGRLAAEGGHARPDGPMDRRPFDLLPVVYRVWVALRARAMRDWVRSAGILRAGSDAAADSLAGLPGLEIAAAHEAREVVAGLALDFPKVLRPAAAGPPR